MYERTLSKAKHYMLLNEMNKKKLTCNVFHGILVSVCRFTVFFFFLGGGGGGFIA